MEGLFVCNVCGRKEGSDRKGWGGLVFIGMYDTGGGFFFLFK